MPVHENPVLSANLHTQLLVDLFVNYDCDLESSNLFERMVNGVVKVAQQPAQVCTGTWYIAGERNRWYVQASGAVRRV